MAGERFDEDVNAIIDAAIAEVGAEKPSPDFAARLRIEIERAPRRAAVSWPLPAIGLTAAAIVVFVVARGFDVAPVSDIPRPEARAQLDVRPAAEPRPEVPVAPRPVAAKPRSKPQPGAADSVLVPRREREAVGRLFASLRAGNPEVVSALGRLGAGTADDLPVSIPPIRIEPVAVPPVPSAPPVMFDR